MQTPVTATVEWYRKRVAPYGNEDGKDFFFAFPPVKSAPIWKEGLLVPRVLVCGTSSEVRTLRTSNPLQESAPSAMIYAAALKYDLQALDVLYVTHIANFWEKFFGIEDFVGNSRQRHLPALVVTTGEMRNHDYRGAGETVPVYDWLQIICAEWSVPLERIPGDDDSLDWKYVWQSKTRGL